MQLLAVDNKSFFIAVQKYFFLKTFHQFRKQENIFELHINEKVSLILLLYYPKHNNRIYCEGFSVFFSITHSFLHTFKSRKRKMKIKILDILPINNDSAIDGA